MHLTHFWGGKRTPREIPDFLHSTLPDQGELSKHIRRFFSKNLFRAVDLLQQDAAGDNAILPHKLGAVGLRHLDCRHRAVRGRCQQLGAEVTGFKISGLPLWYVQP